MKGIIQAYALFVLLMGISLGFMIYIRIDAIQYMSRMILNQSLHETMYMLDSLENAERVDSVNEIINQNIRLRKVEGYEYVVNVHGFHPEPLALRVKMLVGSLGIDPKTWEFDETMIEVAS